MNKKIFALAMLPLTLGLVGCGGTSDNASSAKPSVADTPSATDDSTTEPAEETGHPFITEPTEITLWSITGKNNQAQLQSYIDEFMKLEPNVTVTNTIQTGMGYNELKAAVVQGFAANNYPDIVQCYPDHVAEYINYGKAVQLDSYIDNADYGWTAEDKEDIYQTFIDEGKSYAVEGTYSVPYCKSTEAMFYNEDVLVGLNLASVDATINEGKPLTKAYLENLTWEELFNKLCPAIIAYNDTLSDSAKILKSDQDYHAVFAYDSDDNFFITLAEQYGYGYTSVDPVTGEGKFDFGVGEDKANLVALLKKFNEYAKKGYVISKGSAGNNYTNTYFTQQNTLFSIGSTGGVKYQFDSTNPMNVGVAPIPHAEGKALKTINQGPSLAILDHANDNKKLASWLLYKTITNEENSLDWAVNSGYMGIRKSNAEADEFKEASDADSKDAKTLDRLTALSMSYSSSAKVLNSLYAAPAFVGSSTARSSVGSLMTYALTTTNDMANLESEFDKAYNQCLLASQA